MQPTGRMGTKLPWRQELSDLRLLHAWGDRARAARAARCGHRGAREPDRVSEV